MDSSFPSWRRNRIRPEDLPTSDAFISPLPQRQVTRLQNSGWAIEPTLFVEIGYCAESGAGAGLLRDHAGSRYYQVLYLTTGVVDALGEDELAYLVAHEMSEVQRALAAAVDPAVGGLVSSAARQAEHKADLPRERARHGPAVDRALETIARASATAPIIPRSVALFWLTHYVLFRANALRHLALVMPKPRPTRGGMAALEVLNEVRKTYGDRLPAEAERRVVFNIMNIMGIATSRC